MYFCDKYRALFKSSSWLCVYILLAVSITRLLLRIPNKYFFVYYFIVLLYLHIWIQLFHHCKGLILLCRIIVYVIIGFGCLWPEPHDFTSSLSTSSRVSSAFSFGISKASYNFFFVLLVVNSIISCFSTSCINRLSFSL